MRERLSKNTREPGRGPLLVQSANPNQLVYLPRPHRVKKAGGILTGRGKVKCRLSLHYFGALNNN
jgi:hypothetical protein